VSIDTTPSSGAQHDSSSTISIWACSALDRSTPTRCGACANMHDVEGHTSATCATCSSPGRTVTRHVTAFLTCWNYEEHWHGDAIGRVLDAHGEIAGRSRLSEMRRRLPKARTHCARSCSTSPRPSPATLTGVCR